MDNLDNLDEKDGWMNRMDEVHDEMTTGREIELKNQ